MSSVAFAEHDATYCGRLIPAEKVDEFSDMKPLAILVVDYVELTGSFPGEYTDAQGFAAIYETQTQSAKRNLKRFVKSAKAGRLRAKICVKGLWGGSLYDSSDINSIRLASDSVDRVDYARNFKN